MAFISVSLDRVQGREFFPMPLVPMEHFMLWDDTPDYPKRFRVLFDLKGNLRRELLEQAVKFAAERHPLLLARLDAGQKLPQWYLPEEPQLAFRWLEGAWHDPPFADQWDLSRESGVRIWVSHSQGNFQVSFEVHHAAADGLGTRQFVADIIIAYDHLCAGKAGEPELKKLIPERLLKRGVFSRPKPGDDFRPTTTWEKISQAYQFHFKGPAALARSCASPIAGPQPKRHIYRRFVLDESQRATWERSLSFESGSTDLREPSSRNDEISNRLQSESNASFNDLIVARFFQVMSEWNRKHAGAKGRQRLRVMIPTDLRTYNDGRMPAANRLGFGFVVTNVDACRNLKTLTQQVTLQTQAVRKFSLGLDFVEIFGALAKVPGLAKRLVRFPRCMATGVLTNLGDLSRRHRRALVDASEFIKMGNTRLEFVTCFPPLRPKTHLGIGVCGTRDNLTIGLVLDAKHYTEQDADELSAAMVKCRSAGR